MDVKTVLDEYDKKRVMEIIERGMELGKTFEEIAEALRDVFKDDRITPQMVQYFWLRETGKLDEAVSSSTVDVAEEEDDEEVDVIANLEWLYREQKKRVLQYRRMERETGLPIPDTANNIKLLLDILVKLARLRGEFEIKDPRDLLFKDWAEYGEE